MKKTIIFLMETFLGAGSTAMMFAALVLLSGCYGNAIYVDARFTTEEQAELRRGADMWGRVGLHADLVFGERFSDFDGDRNMVVRAPGERAAIALDERLRDRPRVEGSTARGIFLAPTKIVIVMSRLTEPLSIVFAHELGHGFKLNHVGDPRAIMYERRNEASLDCLTTADIGEACARGGGCVEPRPIGCEWKEKRNETVNLDAVGGDLWMRRHR